MADPGLLHLIQESPVPELLPPPALPAYLEALLFPGRAVLTGIHTVIFDVYGTLFTSAAGDIASSGGTGAVSDRAAGRSVPGDGRLEVLAGEFGCTGQELREHFHREVLRLHRELGEKTDYPELRVEEIWAEFLNRYGETPTMSVQELALRYELAVNPAYPMPGARDIIGTLKHRGIRLGLISNAQFFTPLLFEAFFNAPPKDLGFDPELLIYSFELGEAKPSPNLFSPAVLRLKSLGLEPENALYIGNDMLNDISAAARAGFKTALFAGDYRSLRLREGDSRVKGVRPDRVIRNLKDLSALLAETA
ncbi:HAD family hydrolase [Treponema primitia]|uniref:HAD family hydrolase n=1 Tax=Treponema primitia TaxID=88058 RepID=UPI000316F7A8|nr:HAD family hydrolase [Treponema primitia]